MPLPDLVYASGDHSIAKAASLVVTDNPFGGVNAQYILTQDFMQYGRDYDPLPLNTEHPDYPEFTLQAEGKRQDMGGGLVKWTRTYCRVPDSRSEPVAMAYNFIGFASKPAGATSYVAGRGRFVKPVTGRIQYDYYLVDGIALATPQAIPLIAEQLYYVPLGSLTKPDPDGPFVFTPINNDDDLALVRGLVTDIIWDTEGDYATNDIPSRPSRTEYDQWRADGTEICAEGSQVSRWMGNIYVRATKFVIPE